jgi:hypothetical protein
VPKYWKIQQGQKTGASCVMSPVNNNTIFSPFLTSVKLVAAISISSPKQTLICSSQLPMALLFQLLPKKVNLCVKPFQLKHCSIKKQVIKKSAPMALFY